MVLDPIPQSLPVHFFGSRPQPPTSRELALENFTVREYGLRVIILCGKFSQKSAQLLFHIVN